MRISYDYVNYHYLLAATGYYEVPIWLPMFKNFNFLLTLRSQTSFLCLCSYHFNQYPSSPQEGVLWISSARDDQMGAKIKMEKSP